MQYIRLLLFYSVIFQSVIFSPSFSSPANSSPANSAIPLSRLQLLMLLSILTSPDSTAISVQCPRRNLHMHAAINRHQTFMYACLQLYRIKHRTVNNAPDNDVDSWLLCRLHKLVRFQQLICVAGFYSDFAKRNQTEGRHSVKLLL